MATKWGFLTAARRTPRRARRRRDQSRARRSGVQAVAGFVLGPGRGKGNKRTRDGEKPVRSCRRCHATAPDRIPPVAGGQRRNSSTVATRSTPARRCQDCSTVTATRMPDVLGGSHRVCSPGWFCALAARRGPFLTALVWSKPEVRARFLRQPLLPPDVAAASGSFVASVAGARASMGDEVTVICKQRRVPQAFAGRTRRRRRMRRRRRRVRASSVVDPGLRKRAPVTDWPTTSRS